MLTVIHITLKGFFRDRAFQGIIALAFLFLLIPSVASVSMRQVTELATTLSFSLVSFILLLLSVFLGATSVWRDIERRYTFSVMSLPLTRSEYLVARFLGIVLFLLITAVFLGVMTGVSIKIATSLYPPVRPVLWSVIVLAILFDVLKYILVVAITITISTISTSSLLPILASLSIFFAGTVTQDVYEYLQTTTAQTTLSPIIFNSAKLLYYILPNLSGFDLKVNAVYSICPSYEGLFFTSTYFLSYIVIVLYLGTKIFNNREFK